MSNHDQEEPSASRRKFWLWEVWLENRETVKLIAGDALIFLLLMGIVSALHYFIAQMPLEETTRASLESWHFRFIMLAWILLSVTLFVEIAIASWERIRWRIRSAAEAKGTAAVS